MKDYYIGIDTSAYTSSMSIIDNKDNIVYDFRKVLEVKKDKRGLRQQEALFQHLKNLPLLLGKIDIDFQRLKYVAVSSKPVNTEESYMPVFLQGVSMASTISKSLSIELKEFSHQEGHIGAGMISNRELENKKFLSLHLSGGTTDIIIVEDNKDNLRIEKIGESLDISFGQLIDRIGVYLGYNFPCGKEVDLVSQNGEVLDMEVPISIKEKRYINISGLENYFIKLIDEGKYKIEDILITLFHTLNRILGILITDAVIEYNINNILITGGVASNLYIRNNIKNVLPENTNIYFPKGNLSTDNSVGIAYLGKYKKGHEMGVI